MGITRTILFKCLVRPFYKQNAGLFAFVIFIMVAAVGRANGVGLLEYHFSLIRGMMTNIPFLLFTLSIWFLYALKCIQFITASLVKRENIFLSLLSLKKPVYIFSMMLLVQIALLLPVLLYSGIAICIGIIHHWWVHATGIILFLLFLLLSAAALYQYKLSHPAPASEALWIPLIRSAGYSSYTVFLLNYMFASRKLLFLVIKICSCGMLYAVLDQASDDRSGFQMMILFYSFCLLGHGVLIYLVRNMEENFLRFYRGLPVSLATRFFQYALFYFIILIPEILVIYKLSPAHTGYLQAILLILYSYSILLFLNSLLFIQFFRKFDYLKILSVLFLFIFIAVLTGLFPVLWVSFLTASIYIFFLYFYRFEKV